MNMMLPTMMMTVGWTLMVLPPRIKLVLTPVVLGSILRSAYPPTYTEEPVLNGAIARLETVH